MTDDTLQLSHRAFFEGKPRGPINLPETITSVKVGQETVYAPQHSVRLDESLDVILDWRQQTTNFDPFRSDDDVLITFDQGEPLDVITFNRTMQMTAGETEFLATPAASPFRLSGSEATKACGLIVNGPKLLASRHDGLHFNCRSIDFTVQSFNHTFDIYKGRQRTHSPPAITHSIGLTRQSGGLFDDEVLFETAGRLVGFLGFVKGTRVGHGHYYTAGPREECSFKLLGFTKYDRLKSPPNWFYQGLTSELPSLFEAYMMRMETKEARKTLGRALQYYKASNVAQSDATEVALLLSVAGLEAFATYVLTFKSKWSKKKLNNTPLAEKLRQATRLLGISEEPTIMSDHLRRRIADKGTADFDGFTMLVKFRDGLIHPLEFQYTGPELIDAWFAAQWLLEVSILVFLGYRGKYQDRRRQRGAWVGTLFDLPLK